MKGILNNMKRIILSLISLIFCSLIFTILINTRNTIFMGISIIFATKLYELVEKICYLVVIFFSIKIRGEKETKESILSELKEKEYELRKDIEDYENSNEIYFDY